MKRRILPAIVSILLLILALCLPAMAAETVYFETNFNGTPYTGMDPTSGGSTSFVVDKLCGTDFLVEAVIKIRSITKDTGRGVKFILRECPVAGSGDLEVWLGHNDIWACTNGWKGNGTTKGFSIDPYMNRDLNVKVEINGDMITLYLDDQPVWAWEDASFSAGGQTNIEIGGWDSKYTIKSVRVTSVPDRAATEEHFDPVPQLGGTTYYVDSFAPDGGDGLTPGTAWNDLDDVNYHGAFLPDDKILFKRNSIWEGVTLSPRGSGIEGHPIIIDSYGDGQLPILDRKGEFIPGGTNGTSTLVLENQSYWTIRNIQISNHNPKSPGTLEDPYITDKNVTFPMRNGIAIKAKFVSGYQKKIVRGITVENVVFEGIDSSHGDEGNCYVNRIENISAGSGGSALSFGAHDTQSGSSRSYFDGILVENCTFLNNGGTAISTGSGWKFHDSFHNVVIRGNRIANDPDIPLSCTGMYIVSAVAPLVENNSIRDMTNGIGFQLCRDVTAQYNTIVNMDGYLELCSRISGKAQYWDGCGIDTDCGCLGTSTIRNNFVERCQAGSFAAFDYKDTQASIIILEDNISYNCGTFLYYQCNNAMYDFIIRNNTVVRLLGCGFAVNPELIHIYSGVLDKGSVFLNKNIFYCPNQMIVMPSVGCAYNANSFTCINVNVKDPAALTGDPQLKLPESPEQTQNISWDGSITGTSSLLASGLFKHLPGSRTVSGGKVICGLDLGVLTEQTTDPSKPTDTPSSPAGDSNTPSQPAGSTNAPTTDTPAPNKPTEAPGTVTDEANDSWWIPALFSVICGSSIAIAFALRKKQ